MTGVLFLIIVPRAEHEIELRKWEKSSRITIEADKYESCNKSSENMKINRKFATLRSKSNREYFARDDTSVILSKCKSTDCLHSSEREKGLEKSNSETVLREEEKRSLGVEYKNYVKTSWDEIKQTIKPRKQKLKITSRNKHDHLAAFHCDTTLETILSDVLKRLHIRTDTWSLTKENNFWQVVFSLNSGHLCEEVLQVLRIFGIGSRYHSSVSIIPCALYYKKKCADRKTIDVEDQIESSWAKFTSSVRSRTNLAQVLHEVRSDATLTFDWLFLLVVAAFVAAIGLVENSTVILVASMLISPLMGPITAGTLGTSLKDRCLQRMGLQHELLGLFLSLIIGFVFGLAICAVDEHYGVGDWPTNEMMSRCEIRSLWVGVLVAIPSGAGVALAVLGEYTASLVGVAISASLLPPAVNAGLLWAMSLVHLIFMDDDTKWTAVVKTTIYSKNQAVELAALGAVSLCLTLVNIVCIFLAGVAVYKVKEVSPMEPRDLTWWRSGRESNRKFTSTRNHRNDDDSAWEFYRWCQRSEDAKTQPKRPSKSDESSSPTNCASDLESRHHDSTSGYPQPSQNRKEDTYITTEAPYKSLTIATQKTSEPIYETAGTEHNTTLPSLVQNVCQTNGVNDYVNSSLNSADSLEQSLNYNSIGKLKHEKASYNLDLTNDGYVSINYNGINKNGFVLNRRTYHV